MMLKYLMITDQLYDLGDVILIKKKDFDYDTTIICNNLLQSI